MMLAVRESVRESASHQNDNDNDNEGSELMDLTLEDIVAAIVPKDAANLTAVQEKSWQ
jgi:hypothetical protein